MSKVEGAHDSSGYREREPRENQDVHAGRVLRRSRSQSAGVEGEKSSVTTPGLAGWSQAATILCTGSRTCGGAQPNADPGFALLLEDA